MSVTTKIKEARDKVVEIFSRPKEVLSPGYDPNPGIKPGRTYTESQIPDSLKEATTGGYGSGGRSTRGSSSGGGSSGPSQADLEKQRQEQLRKQEELRKTLQEKDKLLKAIEKQRQEKIKSGTISGQVSSNQSPSFGEITPGQTGGAYVTPMFVTEKEEKQIKESGGTTRPIYSLGSGGGSAMAQAINVEQKYIGGLNLTDKGSALFGGELSKGQFESNTAQIKRAKRGAKTEIDLISEGELIGKKFKEDPTQFKGSLGYTEEETKEGIQYGLGEEYFKTTPAYQRRKSFESEYDEEGNLKQEFFTFDLMGAREDFYKLPKGKRIKSALGDLAIGTAQAGAGVIEFGADVAKTIYGNFAVKTSKKGEFGKDILGLGEFKKQSYFKGLSQTPVSQPLKPAFTLGSAKELITETPGYLAQGIPGALAITSIPTSSISLSGTREGLKILSPIRIKEGTFTPLAYEMATQKQGVKSLTLDTGKGKLTFTEFKGKSGSNVKVTQISGKSGKDILGSSFTEAYNIPYLKIESGGSGLSFGRTNIYSAARFKGGNFGNIFKGYADTTFTSAELGFGASKNVPVLGYTQNIVQSPKVSLYGFAGGRSSALIDKDLFFQVKRYQQAIESPTRGYGVNLDISDLFKSKGGGGGSNINIIRGRGTQTPLSKTFGQDTIQIQKVNFEAPKITSTTTPTISNINILKTTRIGSNILVPIQTKTNTNLNIAKENLILTPKINVFQPSRTQTSTRTSTLGSTRTRTSQIQSPLLRTRQIQGISQIQNLRGGQVLRTIQSQIQLTPTSPVFSGGFVTPGIFGAGLPLKPYTDFVGRPGRRRTQKGKQITGYRPSFTASALGITASKVPLLAPGGLSLRPIIVSKSQKKKKKKRKKKKS